MSETTSLWNEIYKRQDLPWLKNDIPYVVLDKFTSLLPKKPHILDYGCGTGLFFDYYQQHNFAILGVDASTRALEIAHKKFP